MKLPGGFDLGNLNEMMKQAQQMQEEMQRELQQVKVEASVGGGIVTIAMDGTKQVLDVKLDPETVKSGDVEMLQDMLIAAFNEASRKAEEKAKGNLGSKLGGLGLPDGMF
jgi:nucleoid-associated protein EbfC